MKKFDLLTTSIMFENITEMKKMLDDGFPINKLSQSGLPVLLYRACLLHKFSALNALIEYGANPDIHKEGVQSLLIKMMKEHLAVPAMALLIAGADPNKKDPNGYAPLYFALTCEANDAPALIATLIQHGADLKEFKAQHALDPLEHVVKTMLRHNIQALLDNGYMQSVEGSQKTIQQMIQFAQSCQQAQVENLLQRHLDMFRAKEAIIDVMCHSPKLNSSNHQIIR